MGDAADRAREIAPRPRPHLEFDLGALRNRTHIGLWYWNREPQVLDLLNAQHRHRALQRLARGTYQGARMDVAFRDNAVKGGDYNEIAG
jgi:hypothetical protein